MCIGQITFWSVLLYFQICTYLTTCWNFQSFLIIRQRDVIFFLNFQTYQENILKIFNSFWNTMADPTNKLLAPPSQAQWKRELSPGTPKGLKPTTF
jgi:hypothetical protein